MRMRDGGGTTAAVFITSEGSAFTTAMAESVLKFHETWLRGDDGALACNLKRMVVSILVDVEHTECIV